MTSFEFGKTGSLEIRHLVAFVAVYEERHFARAAKRIGIAQPKLSLLLQRVEDVVGHPLFVRRPAVRPTPAAEAFIAYARRLLGELEDGVSALRNAAEGRTGSVRLAYPTWIAATFVPDAIASFRNTHPNVDIQLQTLHTDEQLKELASGKLDMGFVRDLVPGGDLVAFSILQEDWLVALPSGHRKASAERLAPQDLDGEEIAGAGSYGRAIQSRLDDLLRAAGARASLVYEAPSWYTILSWVRSGSCIAVVPRSQTNVWRDTITYVPFCSRTFTSTVSVVHHRNCANPAAIALRDAINSFACG